MNKLIALVLIASFAVVSMPVQAYSRNKRNRTSGMAQERLSESDSAINKKQAGQIAKKRHGGKVLSIKKSIKKNGEGIYLVKLIKKGRVKIVEISENSNETFEDRDQ